MSIGIAVAPVRRQDGVQRLEGLGRQLRQFAALAISASVASTPGRPRW